METDTVYLDAAGAGTGERMKVETNMKLKRCVRFYIFDVPKGAILTPSGRRDENNEPSEACVIL